MVTARIRLFLVAGISLLLLSLVFVSAESARADGNLLVNPSFEGGTYLFNNDGDQRVPNGWLPWWTSPVTNGCYNFKPHYEIEQHPSHVWDGSSAARYYTAYSSHKGGLMQTVSVVPGQRYRFSIYGFAWSTNDPVVDTPSETYTKLWVGIDPTGGTDGNASTVVWSPENAHMDTYALFTVEATAQASHITVFTRSRPDWCVARNDSFWDGASLTMVGTAASPTQPPTPTGGTVTATATITLNIRNGPTIYNEIIGYLPAGATATVLGRDAATQWIYINKSGTTGWVAGWLCTINGDLNSLPVVGPGGTVPPPTPTGQPSPSGGVTATPNLTLNMRSGPGVTFPVIGYVPAGVVVPVVGRDSASNWILVNQGGTQGWIAGWLCTISGDLSSVPVGGGTGTTPTQPPPSPPSPLPGGVTATANLTLNIRSGPSTNHDIIGYVPGGETVTVLGRADDSQWIYIIRNNVKGWIAGWLCTIAGDLNSLPVAGHSGTGSTGGTPLALTGSPTVVSIYTVNIHSGPGADYAIIDSVLPGVTLDVLGRDPTSSWLLVNYNGTQGWVARWLFTVSGDLSGVPIVGSGGGSTSQSPPPTATAAPPPSPSGVTASPSTPVNIRSGPGAGYGIIGALPGGAIATVIGRADDSQWIQIDYQSTQGWIAGWLCSITGDVNTLPVTGHTGTGGSPSAGTGGGPSGGSNTAFALGGQVPDSINHPNEMHSARMTWVKMQLEWTPGLDPSAAAGFITLAHTNGFKILLGVTGGLYPSSINFVSYVDFLRGLAALNPDGIEVWNEMNLSREWPAGQINPSSYVNNMLQPAYQAIKGVNPSILVVAGALAPTGVNDGYNVWSDDVYLAGMRSAGAASAMDCLGAHYNAGATPPNVSYGHPADSGSHHYSWYFEPTLNLYASTFATTKVCFTELGYLSPEGYGPLSPTFWWGANTSVADQAAWLAGAVSLARTSGRVALVIVYNVDFTEYGDDPQAGYAIVRPSGACPACATLASVAP